MTEAEWVATSEPVSVSSFPMLEFAQGKASERKLRLFCVACCRRIAHVVPNEDLRRLLDVSEAYADGNSVAPGLRKAVADWERLESLSDRWITVIESIALDAIRGLDETMDIAVAGASRDSAAVMGHLLFAAQNLTEEEARQPVNPQGVSVKMLWINKGWKQEYLEQSRILKDICGNPFRAVAFDSDWRTEDTVGISLKMYEERDFGAMPILADALEKAGCVEESILGHCREPGVHVRGYWVVDLVLGKA